MDFFYKLVFVVTVLLAPQCESHPSREDLEDVSGQLWQSGIGVVHATYTWQNAVDFIHQDSRAIKSWASDTSPTAFCSLVHKADWGRIWSLSFFYSLNALFVRDEIIPLFQDNDYVLIPFWGDVREGNHHRALLKNAKYPQNFYFLGNGDQETAILRDEGMQAFTVSHNAFIDADTFYPVQTPNNYKAVYLGCCRPQKRLDLARSLLSDLLVVTSSSAKEAEVVSNAKKVVYNPSPHMFKNYVCQAACGLMLSKSEGGCYASTEYLYCGVPVVSVKSRGGRDAYYDDVSALIVDDTPEAVKEGVETMCRRSSDPWEIRRRALAVSNQMLDTLAYDILLPILQYHEDSYAEDPRGFVDAKIGMSRAMSSKGRTVFQPENPTHDSRTKIKSEQIIRPSDRDYRSRKYRK